MCLEELWGGVAESTAVLISRRFGFDSQPRDTNQPTAMAKKSKKTIRNKQKIESSPSPQESTKENEMKTTTSLFQEVKSQFEAAEEYQTKHKDDPYCSWNEKEALLLGRNLDSISNTSKSQVFDPRLSTIIIERMNRVMAQHATGKVRALDNPKDKLPSLVLDMALQRYIIPNANSQYDLLTKFKLQDFYSLAYGSYVSLVDYRIDQSYIGPDVWLIPMRHFYPEANAVNDLNHCFIDTWVTKAWLESRNKEIWKNIDFILAELDKKGADKDSDSQSLAESENRIAWGGKGKGQLIHLRTRYEPDRWVTYAVDAVGLEERAICRDIANPQGNDEIPVVVKHAFPLIDRFYGLGEFERAKTLQYATNSLWNLYLDGLKMRIFPPRIVNSAGVVPSSLGYFPGATWQETQPNSIRPWVTGSQSENAFQSTYSALIAATLNQAGTTNIAAGSDVVDPGMGKTPQALRMMGARESSRDAWDRYLMEKTVEKTFNLMIDLLVKKQEKPINFELFEGEIKRLENAFPEQAGQLAEIFESKTFGKMKVEKGTLQGKKEDGQYWKYRFDIDPGTTMQKDQQEEHLAVTEIIAGISKIPGAMEQIGATGKIKLGNKVIDFGELFKRHIITSGIQDWERIVTEEAEQVMAEGAVEQELSNDPLDPKTEEMMSQLGQLLGQDGSEEGLQQDPNVAAMEMGGMQ